MHNDSRLTFLLLIISAISSAAGLPYSSSGVNWKGITWRHSSTRLPCWKERRPKWDDKQCRHDAGDEQEVSRVSSTLHSPRNLGPNSLIFSFSPGASPAHNAGGWVLPLFSQQIFLTKEVDKRDGKMIVAHYPPLYMGSFGCYALDSRVC